MSAIEIRTIGCPARSSASTAASCDASGADANRTYTNTRSLPYTSGGPSGSRSTGMRPFPSLPVDSASSCSSQAPRSETPGDVMRVTLSRPLVASTPRIVPRTTPGFSSIGTHEEQACTISSARSRNFATSTPMMAAGTIPKFERAEYRPPMLGTPKRMCLKPSLSATCCILEPGSVTAMNRCPASFAPRTCVTRSKKYCLKMFGSSVPPDLLETIKSVLARSTLFSNVLTCAGSVESRTCSSGKPPTLPNVIFITSGHMVDPPIPNTMA